MSKLRIALLAALAALLAAGAVGSVYALLLNRFERGEVCAPYSSFRCDPLGTRALYETLRRLPHFTVERFCGYKFDSPHPKKTVLLYLGEKADRWRYRSGPA